MRQTTRMGRIHLVGAALAVLAAAGCASSSRVPYTESEARRADIGVSGMRTWGDTSDAAFTAKAKAAITRPGSTGAYLALSGGGGDGAYGAGFLNGWSETGRRPEFAIVSGVSTGALIAPFAFLGPRYDAAMRDVYTSGVAETLIDSPDLIGAIFGSSLFSSNKLRELIDRYLTPQMIDELAQAGRRGRLLTVVTTNLDAQRPVVWDLTALAMEGSERSQRLLRDALVASASIPAVFPPVIIDATADGKSFGEMHVDGTVTTSVFTLPRAYLFGARSLGRAPRAGQLYVIMNAKLETDFNVVPNTGPGVVTRTVSTFVKTNSRADIVDTYKVLRQSGLGFHLTFIDKSFPTDNGAGFDTAYMRRLYDYGFERGRAAMFRDAPPDLVPSTVASR